MLSKKSIPAFLMILLVVPMIFGCSGSAEPAGDENPATVIGTIDAGKREVAASGTVDGSGGTVSVTTADSPVAGLKIAIPAGAYESAVDVEVAYAPVEEHSYGDDFNPVSPMIIVDNGDEYAAEPMEVTIPVEVPEGHFAMGFLYDEDSKTLEGLPLVSQDDDSITVATRHFSNIIISAIDIALLGTDIDSGFRPGVDDWQFANRGSYLQPGGHCSGQSMTAMWYYVTRPEGAGKSLYGAYDNNGSQPTTPEFWYDDSLGYRFASVVQLEDDYDSKLLTMTSLLSNIPEDTWHLFCYSMLMTGEPQLVGINDTVNGGGHAMVVYRVSQGKLHVADPNYPGATDRVIEYSNGLFTPYNSGANAEAIAEGKAKQYNKIIYIAKSAFVDWDRIASRWQEVRGKTIGNDVFPSYGLEWVDDQNNYHELEDGLVVSDEILRIGFDSAIGNKGGFYLYRDGNELTSMGNSRYRLEPGTNRLGFYIVGQIPDGRYKFIDFKYYDVTYEPAQTTTTTTSTTTTQSDIKRWVLAETILPDLPEQPETWSDQFGTHEMTLVITESMIICDVRTPSADGESISLITLSIDGVPEQVTQGEKVETTATWEFTGMGTPRYTSSFVELRRGDFQSARKPFTLEGNPMGSATLTWTPGGDEFEVTVRLNVRGDQGRIRWVYRLAE